MSSKPEEIVGFALAKYPGQIEVVPIEELILDSARQNPRRPAYVSLAVPDELVKALRGKSDDRDQVFLVRVPKAIAGRTESRIVLPNEVRRP
jgi:hypothetical protein